MPARSLLATIFVLLLTACAGGPPPDPIVVNLPELSERERQRLYDGLHQSPPLLDVNRALTDAQRTWPSDELTWIKSPAGWYARLRFVSPRARGLRIGLCVEPATVPVILAVEETNGEISLPVERMESVCENQSMYFLPLVGGDTVTLRFSSPPRDRPPVFDLTIHRVQHRGN